jgi:AmiR/NasT family two-component response regulator
LASTRILVADSPRLQREIVTELLLDRADVEMVEATALYEEAEHRRPDVVILGEDDPAMARALLEASPRLVVLALADSELVARRYGLTPYRECLGELSPAALSAGIEPRDPLPSWWTS